MQKSFKNREHNVLHEVLGVITFFIAVFLSVAIISFNKSDLTSEIYTNSAGEFGAYAADSLLQWLGIGAYLFVILLFFVAARLVFVKDYKFRFIKIVSVITFVVSTSSLLQLFFIDNKTFSKIGYEVGGAIGGYVGKALLFKHMNLTGAYLVVISLLILSVMIFENTSFIPMLEKIIAMLQMMSNRIRDWYIKRHERARKTKEITKKLKIQKKTPREEPKISDFSAPGPKISEPVKVKAVQENFSFANNDSDYKLPPVELLNSERVEVKIDKESLLMNSRILEKKLLDYGVKGAVVQVHPGPVVTQFEYEPAPGVKVNKIVNLQDDLSMALRAVSIRIVAPIPGKSVVGIEIPNNNREIVYMRDIIESESFQKSSSRLSLALGKDIAGKAVSANLARMPHLLIAGATGSGKSVGLNTMICSILYKATPEEVRFILIDPKMLELITYEDIPHLLLPIVTDPKKAAAALRWAVSEMERRYKLMSKTGVRNINSYNVKLEKELAEQAKKKRTFLADDELGEPPKEEKKLPYIVLIIDELADLMMVASKEVETSIARLAQMARAAGIHLILATQRPSVDVLTGLIKANFPARMSFQVSARTDSRTILDAMGAERLLGHGDMLFLPPGTAKVQRVHGAYISDDEILRLVDFWKEQGVPEYDEELINNIDSAEGVFGATGSDDDEYDEKYDEALRFVSELGNASISLIQRRFKIGYNRAARIIEQMEKDGIVGPSDGSKPRKVLVNKI